MTSDSEKRSRQTQQVSRVYVHPKTRPGTDLLSHELPWMIEFHVVGFDHMIAAPVRSAITIGRSDPESGIKPDVDLGLCDGYQRGVSRRHAIILVRGDTLVLRALNTTNGTWINDVQLSAGEESRLRNGDVVTIGSLQMEALFTAAPARR